MKHNKKVFNKLVHFIENNLDVEKYHPSKNAFHFFCYDDKTHDIVIYIHMYRIDDGIFMCIDNHQSEIKFDEYLTNFNQIKKAKTLIKSMR